MNLIKTLNKERQDWTKNIIRSYKKQKPWLTSSCKFRTLSNQLKLPTLNWQRSKQLYYKQTTNNYKTQIAEDIFSILQGLQNIIQGNMENQAHHIQMLLADELDSYRGKENMYADEHIKEI